MKIRRSSVVKILDPSLLIRIYKYSVVSRHNRIFIDSDHYHNNKKPIGLGGMLHPGRVGTGLMLADAVV